MVTGPHPGDEKGLFRDVPDRVGDLDPVAQLEGPHVGQDDAGYDVGDG